MDRVVVDHLIAVPCSFVFSPSWTNLTIAFTGFVSLAPNGSAVAVDAYYIAPLLADYHLAGRTVYYRDNGVSSGIEVSRASINSTKATRSLFSVKVDRPRALFCHVVLSYHRSSDDQ